MMLSMNTALQWVVVFTLCASVIISNASLVVAAENNEPDNGVISIDCGANEDYTDTTTNTHYQADSKFVQSGENFNVSPSYSDSYDSVKPNKDQLNTVRSFRNGMRNCYTLKPKQGINQRYLIRAYFAYGNYDYKNEVPSFDLYLGVNFWITIDLNNEADYVVRTEVIYNTSTPSIDLCLINTNRGVPFISLLELWPAGSIYQIASTLLPLKLITRPFLGLSQTDPSFIRYTDDIYGRSWFRLHDGISNSKIIKATAAVNVDGVVDDYKLPKEVLSAAVKALDTSTSLDIFKIYKTFYEYYVYLHFFDFEERADTEKRIIEISFNSDDALTQTLILEYGTPKTVFQLIKKGKGIQKISIKSTNDSDLSAMLNALEIYKALPQPNSAAQQQDVDAIREIKHVYKIPTINWQGDPCGPKNFIWEGITCSPDNNPRIISLNLSSYNLAGSIDASFSNLTNLEVLDLSNNELTGKVPTFFADLTKLKILNLTGNKLIGPIPEALILKSKDNSLQLRLDGNTGLCEIGSCKRINNVVKLAASIAAASVAVVIIIVVIISVIIHRRKRKNGTVMSQRSKKDEQLKSKNQAFSYSEVISITNDFKTVIGEGGFGKVYLGALQDGKRVAVKLLSFSSKQGFKEFQLEASWVVHHRHLVSLVGYCDEGDIKALIYEFMSNGNLQKQLSDNNKNVLKWKERLQIALDAAHGLDYLHNGCKPPVIHRDLKPSNILLDENMKAKISDFGLSRTFANDIDTHVSTRPAGTPGYLDPQFHSSGIINKKSDVYSFGIVLLELITGQPALIRTDSDYVTHIPRWVNLKLKTGDIQVIVDPRLQGEYNTASASKYIEIAMSCTAEAAIQRPDISHIVSELKECLSLDISSEMGKSCNSFDMVPSNIESFTDPYPR